MCGCRNCILHFPDNILTRIIFTCHTCCKLLCIAFFDRYTEWCYFNTGNSRNIAVRTNGYRHFVSISFDANNLHNLFVCYAIAFRNTLALKRIGSKLYRCHFFCADVFYIFAWCVINLINNIWQHLTACGKCLQRNVSCRLCKSRCCYSVFIRNQFSCTFHLKRQLAACPRNADALKHSRSFADCNRLWHSCPCLSTRLINIYHVARIQSIDSHGRKNVIKLRRTFRTRLWVFFKWNLCCRCWFFCCFCIKRSTLFDALETRRRCGRIINTACFVCGEIKIFDCDSGQLLISGCLCNLRADLCIGIARFDVHFYSFSNRNMFECENVSCSWIVSCRSKVRHGWFCLWKLIGIKHLPFINSNRTPSGGTCIIDVQSPLSCRYRFIQQHVSECQLVVLNPFCFDPLTFCIFIFQCKINGIHFLWLAAVFCVLHTPASDGYFSANIDGHIAAVFVGRTPFWTVCCSSVKRFCCRFCIVFKRNICDCCSQTEVFKFDRFIFFRIFVSIQPVNCKCCSFAANTVFVDRDNFECNVLLFCCTSNTWNIQCGVRRFHEQWRGSVAIYLIYLIRRCAGCLIPVQTNLSIICIVIQNAVQCDTARTRKLSAILFRDCQLTKVHLIIGNICIAFNLHADCKQCFACLCRKINRCRCPGICLTGGQVIVHSCTIFVACCSFITIISDKFHFAVIIFVCQAHIHAVSYCNIGAVKHDVVWFSCVKWTCKFDGVAAVISIGEIIITRKFWTFRINDPCPCRHNILVGLIAPFSVTQQDAVYPIAFAVTGVEIRHERCTGDRCFICKETRHANPFAVCRNRRIRCFHTRIGHFIDIECTLVFMELFTRCRDAECRVWTIQRKWQLHFAVCVQQHIITETGVHAVLLYIKTRIRVKRTAVNRIHCVDGCRNLRLIPVVIHKEFISTVIAFCVRLHPSFVLIVYCVLMRNTAARYHCVIPAD